MIKSSLSWVYDFYPQIAYLNRQIGFSSSYYQKSAMTFGVTAPYQEPLDKQNLDLLLAQGYFRHGSIIAAYEMMYFDDKIQGVVPLRSKIHELNFTKSQRKLIRKNRQKYRKEIKPLTITGDKNKLYKLYKKKRFEGHPERTLEDFFGLIGNPFARTVYDTWEIAFYDGEQLAAISFVDLGEDSVASLMCMFHPDYTNDSLGFYSMLEEIEFAKEKGFNYYYPGYTLDMPSCFDYKTRIGSLEFYDWKGEWLEWSSFSPEKTLRSKQSKYLTNCLNQVNELSPTKGKFIEHTEYFNHIWHDTFEVADVIKAPYYLSFQISPYHTIIIQYIVEKGCMLVRTANYNSQNRLKDGILTNDAYIISQFIQRHKKLVDMLSDILQSKLQVLKQKIEAVDDFFFDISIQGDAQSFPEFLWLSCSTKNYNWAIEVKLFGINMENAHFTPSYFSFQKGQWWNCGWAETAEEAIKLIKEQDAIPDKK